MKQSLGRGGSKYRTSKTGMCLINIRKSKKRGVAGGSGQRGKWKTLIESCQRTSVVLRVRGDATGVCTLNRE